MKDLARYATWCSFCEQPILKNPVDEGVISDWKKVYGNTNYIVGKIGTKVICCICKKELQEIIRR